MATKTAAEIPEWVEKMPEDYSYFLHIADENDGTEMQNIPLEREEYELLKRTLAIHRGYISEPLESSPAQVERLEGASVSGRTRDAVEKGEPANVTGSAYVREWYVGGLQDGMETFVKEARLAEIAFLGDALFSWMSCNGPIDKHPGECYIADLLLDRLTRD